MINSIRIGLLFIHLSLCTFGQDTLILPLETFSLHYEGKNYKIDPNYRYKLEELASFLIKNENSQLHIRGHVCCGPSYRLSKRRAKQVYCYFRRTGISKKRLSFKGYSNTMPVIYPEEEEEDEAMNRRVDFELKILNE